MAAYRRGRPNKYNPMSFQGTPPPPVVGEYRIRYQHGNLKYLGITNNLERRMREHISSGKLCDDAPTFEWMPALPGTPYEEIRKHEQEKIMILKPDANKKKGGGGREPTHLNYYEFTDSRGTPCFGIQEDKMRSTTIEFAFSRVFSFIIKLVLVIAVVALVGFLILAYN